MPSASTLIILGAVCCAIGLFVYLQWQDDRHQGEFESKINPLVPQTPLKYDVQETERAEKVISDFVDYYVKDTLGDITSEYTQSYMRKTYYDMSYMRVDISLIHLYAGVIDMVGIDTAYAKELMDSMTSANAVCYERYIRTFHKPDEYASYASCLRMAERSVDSLSRAFFGVRHIPEFKDATDSLVSLLSDTLSQSLQVIYYELPDFIIKNTTLNNYYRASSS